MSIFKHKKSRLSRLKLLELLRTILQSVVLDNIDSRFVSIWCRFVWSCAVKPVHTFCWHVGQKVTSESVRNIYSQSLAKINLEKRILFVIKLENYVNLTLNVSYMLYYIYTYSIPCIRITVFVLLYIVLDSSLHGSKRLFEPWCSQTLRY